MVARLQSTLLAVSRQTRDLLAEAKQHSKRKETLPCNAAVPYCIELSNIEKNGLLTFL
jgi:hypothetical protein